MFELLGTVMLANAFGQLQWGWGILAGDPSVIMFALNITKRTPGPSTAAPVSME